MVVVVYVKYSVNLYVKSSVELSIRVARTSDK